MKKFLEFFNKHKIAIILSTVIFVAVVSLTAVTIALWNSSSDEDTIYTIPENPAEKYLEYYAMTPNAASTSGYDYYPISRVPEALLGQIEGLSVARYDGFATEVEIPSKVTVKIAGIERELTVKHILRNHSTQLSNGFVDVKNSKDELVFDSTVTNVILPETITYVEENALTGVNVYVKGGMVYEYEERVVNGNVVKVTDANDNIIDILVKSGEYYYSTYSYDKYLINRVGEFNKITYSSYNAGVKFDGNALTLKKINDPVKVYGLEDATYQSELRKSDLTYEVVDAAGNKVEDLFANNTGYMISSGGNNYYRYIVFANGTHNVKVNGITLAENITSAGKYKIIYDGTTLTATKVTYQANGVDLVIDLECCDYERYISNEKVSFSGSGNYIGNINNISADGSYIVTYAPDVVFTSGDDVVNYDLDSDKYYLLKFDDDNGTRYTTTVTKEEGSLIQFTTTTIDEENSAILGTQQSYNVGFILPNINANYYAVINNQNTLLTKINDKYYLNANNNGRVKIYGYLNENLVYESLEFDYTVGKIYDLAKTMDYTNDEFIINVENISTDITGEDSFTVIFDERMAKSVAHLYIEATYYDTQNNNKLENVAFSLFDLPVVNGALTIYKSQITNSILANGTIATDKYIFASYSITVGGVEVYKYTNDGLLELDFYQKLYKVSNYTISNLTSSVVFDYSSLPTEGAVVNVNDNTLTYKKRNSATVVGVLERNFANTSFAEYYMEVSDAGYYAVSTASSINNIIYSSTIYCAAHYVFYFALSGYSQNKYSIYSLDGAFVTEMVYQDGNAYASLPTYSEPHGYYVVDQYGNKISNEYFNFNGHYNEVFDYYLVKDGMDNYNGIGMVKSGSSYVATNVYIDGKINVGNASLTLEANYYDLYYDGTNLTASLSSRNVNNYELKVGTDTVKLYPTDNGAIYVGYLDSISASDVIYLYNDERIVTSYTVDFMGSYKVYVNVSSYSVNENLGWINNYFKFTQIKDSRVFKLVNNDLVITNTIIDSNSSTYLATSKVDGDKYKANNKLLTALGDGYYQGLVNVDGTLTINSGITVENLVSGTYQVFYDSNNDTVELSRVEGSKTYYISFDEGVTYHEMFVNSNNNNYEEYILENISLATNVDNVIIKDDLGNITTYTVDFKAGLNTILFSLDNQRRKENNYQIFVNLKSTLDSSAIKVTLTYEEESKVYYLPSDTTSLPQFEEVFALADFETFVGWYTESTFDNVATTLTNDSEYFAKVESQTAYLYINSKYDVTYNDTVVSSILLSDAADTITFTVDNGDNPIRVYINNTLLESINNIYSVSKTSISLPAAIRVIDKNETVTVSMIDINGNKVASDYAYELATYANLPLPTGTNFKYYYDTKTGIVYTDSTGRLISPYLIKDNITLTAFYSNNYYVTVNNYLPDGRVVAESTLASGTVVGKFERFDGYHYSNIVAYQTTNGYPVKMEIDEYLHTYSFNMPQANVIINVNYIANDIENREPVLNGEEKVEDTIYVLVPTAMANEVGMYDSTTQKYLDMNKLAASLQIYPGYVAYQVSFNVGNKFFKVKANGYESYYYELGVTDNKFDHDLFIIDNLSLEDEVCYVSDWISYTQSKNVYHLTNTNGEYTDVYAIHGKIIYNEETNEVTVVEAVSVDTFTYYQYASFIVTYKYLDTYTSHLVTYIADGSQNNPILIDSGDTFAQYIGNTKFRYSFDKHFLQTAENIVVEDANGYQVIFDQDKPFNHIYDGNGNKLTYVQSEIRNSVNNGVFGYIGTYGKVLNLTLDYTLTDTNSTYGYETKYYLGPVASINLGLIDNVKIIGDVISANNVRYAGGIVAHNVGTISNSENHIQIDLYNYGASESRILGGIAGYNGGVITDTDNFAVVTLNGETGREQYVSGISGMNKGTIDDCYSVQISDTSLKASKTYTLEVIHNGGSVTPYEMYQNVYSTADNTSEFAVLNLKLNVGESFRIKNNNSNTYVSLEKDNSCTSWSINGKNASCSYSGTFDIYYKDNWEYDNLYAGNSSNYTITVTPGDGGSNYIIPMTINTSPSEDDKTTFEVMAVSVHLNAGDKFKVNFNTKKLTLTSDSTSRATVDSDSGVATVTKTGTYDLYYKPSNQNMYIGLSTKNSQAVNPDTIKIALVDDWYFIDELMHTEDGTYYFESALRVQYYKGSSYLGDMVYNNAQTYDYMGMDTVIVDILEGTTKIVVSRLMLISCRKTQYERWYYAYDGNTFTKLGNELTSSPENTYSTEIILANIGYDADITDDAEDVVFIYAEASGGRYETTQSSIASVGKVTGEIGVVSYIDVAYSTDVTLGSYRIKYYNGDTLIAVRSYVDGEQIQLLDGVTKMTVEQIEEGSGIRKICDVTPDVTNTTIIFSPGEVESSVTTPSGYTVRVNNDLVNDMYYDIDNPNKVLVASLKLKENDTLYILSSSHLIITDAVLDSYSVGFVSYEDGKITANTNGLFDIYYDTLSNQIIIQNAVVYELVLFDSNNTEVKDSSGNILSYKMYPNPSPQRQNEVMNIGVMIASGQTVKLRRVGDINYLTSFTLDSDLATMLNGVISFTESIRHDFFLYIDERGVVLRISSGEVDNFNYTYDGTIAIDGIRIDESEYTTNVNFINAISNYNDEYVTRVYYLNAAGDYIKDEDGKVLYFDFSTATKLIPIVDGARRLRIVRHQEKVVNEGQINETTVQIEINEVFVNAIYPEKTITLSMPYYGYYDISYSSSVTDQEGIYLDNVDGSGNTIKQAYVNYELNDGRTARITMINNQGKFYVPFDSIIGLNPKYISFTYVTDEKIDTTSEQMLFTVVGDTLYTFTGESGFESTNYTTYTPVSLYVDPSLCLWDEYFILVDGTSYNLMSKSGIANLGGKDYNLYVAYVHGNEFQLASSPDNEVVFKSTTKANTFIMDSIIMGDIITGFTINASETYNYEYYLETETSGLLDAHYGLFKYGEYYIGMHHLADEVTYYVKDNEGNRMSNSITSGEGNHLFIYIDGVLSVIRNEVDYTVTFMYGGNKERVKYSHAEIITHAPVSQAPTDKYTFEFAGWVYSGKTYLVDIADNNKLYYLDGNGEKVYLYAVDAMTITPKFTPIIEEFTITLLNPDGTTFNTITKGYGEKISSKDFQKSNLPLKHTVSTAAFVGWYIDSEMKIMVENYPVLSDLTLYPKWHVKGVFLVGVIEGYTSWDDQREGYEFTATGANHNDGKIENNFILEHVYLEQGDIVKPKEFKITSDDYYFSDWATNSPYWPGDKCTVLYNDYNNLRIEKSGYYSFYIQEHNAETYKQEIHITYQEYLVSYEYDESQLVSDTYKADSWRFSIESNGAAYGNASEVYTESFKLYSEEDKRMGLPLGAKVTTPTLQRTTTAGVEVVMGWYTRPVNGERVNVITENMLKNKNALTLYPNYILGGYYFVDEYGVETKITQNEATTDPESLPKYKENDIIKINYYNGSVASSNGVSTLDLACIENELYAPNVIISGNTIKITQDGLYDFYVTTQIEDGKTVFILHIEQYHEIIYEFSERINPTIGTARTIIISGSKFIQKYGDDLAIVENPNVVNTSGVIVIFENWMKADEYAIPEQKVNGNTTYYPQYDIGDQIYGANISSKSALWNMAMVSLDTPIALTDVRSVIIEVRFNHQNPNLWFRPCATDTNGIVYDAFGKEITDTNTYPYGYWYSVNVGSYTDIPYYDWYANSWGGWTPSWESKHAPTFYVEVELGFLFARFDSNDSVPELTPEHIKYGRWLENTDYLKSLGIYIGGETETDFTLGSLLVRNTDGSVRKIADPTSYTLNNEASKNQIITFYIDKKSKKPGNLNVTLFKPVEIQ